MNFSYQNGYNIIFHKVAHKGGESATNHIKRFQNSKALKISVANGNTEDQLMQTFLDNFHKVKQSSAQIEIQK